MKPLQSIAVCATLLILAVIGSLAVRSETTITGGVAGGGGSGTVSSGTATQVAKYTAATTVGSQSTATFQSNGQLYVQGSAANDAMIFGNSSAANGSGVWGRNSADGGQGLVGEATHVGAFPFTVRAPSGQTADLTRWLVNGSPVASVDSSGVGDFSGLAIGGTPHRPFGFGIYNPLNPPSSGWTPINSPTVTTPQLSRVITATAAGSSSLVGEVRSLTDPQTVVIGVLALDARGSGSGVGIWLRESGTGKLAVYYARTSGVQGESWTNETTFGAAYFSDLIIPASYDRGIGFRVEFGPTNRVVSIVQGSLSWAIHTIAKNDGATTAFDQYGWFVRRDQAINAELFHLTE